MQVSNSTLSGPSDPLGCYYSSARLTNDANGKPHFTEVMNVMLMSVSERRREIGVRLALGATRRDIRLLFLAEAGLLAIVGAALGAVFGVGAAYAFARFSGWDFVLAPASLPLGMGTALLTGLFFGWYPAAAASRLEPVQALRDA